MSFAIKIENVTKKYPGIKALDDITFTVKKGSVHGLLGPNGAGKSTTMNIISGLLKPTTGNIQVHGKVGYLPEVLPLYSDMIVKDYIQFVAEIHGVRKDQAKRNLEKVLQQIGLQEVANRAICNLSKGFKQRVGVASILSFEPEVIVLDEPTVGLDPASVIEMRKLMNDLKKDHTLLLSTHLLHEVQLNCSDVTIIDQGKIVVSGILEEVQQKFQTNKVVVAELGNWEKEQNDFFNSLDFIESLEEKKLENNNSVVRFFMKGSTDQRKRLTSLLIEKNCELYSFREEKMNLEDIFLKVTKESKSESNVDSLL